MKALLLSLIPYARRAFRVFAYAEIPAMALWVSDSNSHNFEIATRAALAAGLLALLDKGRMAVQSARKGS